MPREYQGVPCSKCGKRGLFTPPHAHAFGHLDHSVAECRYCGGRFKAESVRSRRDRLRAGAEGE